jgi:3-dehydroquinate synthase
MKTVKVGLGQRSYDILIGNSIFDKICQHLKEHKIGNRIFLISNTTVFELYGRQLSKCLLDQGHQVTDLLIPDGERIKNLQTVENIYTYLIAQKADRNTTLAALGGGVTGDIVGFAAATYMRGVPYLQIPTTLLSQVDSSVGGKTGVNHQLGKNLIGAFYQPFLVCADISSLKTLPAREYQSGLYEVLKYGLIYDREFFDYVAQNLDEIKKQIPDILETIIGRCCEIKAEIISIDEREENLRRILNFGHTLGHALEAATNYQSLTHGEAVGYGMIAAAALSSKTGGLDHSSTEKIIQTILSIGPLPPIMDVSFDSMLEAMKRDKKRSDNRIVFVLLKSIGQTSISSGYEESLLKEVWDYTIYRTHR